MTVEAAGGHRILNAAGLYKWQDWGMFNIWPETHCRPKADHSFRSVNAARTVEADLPSGDQAYDPSKATHLIQFKSSKFEEILGLKYHTKEETAKAIIENFRERGLWKGQ